MYNNGSKTMFILGEQYTSDYITPEIMQQLQEIFEANITGRGYDIPMLLQDVFILGYIDRLKREKRHGRIEAVDEHTYRFVADVYDAGELVTWARTFIGRIVSFESDNRYIVNRFYDDIRRMAEMYGGGDPQ